MEESDAEMAMPLNINDPEAYQLASEIARHTGKTLTRVVVYALKHEKDALEVRPQDIDLARAHAILARVDKRTGKRDWPLDDLVNDLYDERGLPRSGH